MEALIFTSISICSIFSIYECIKYRKTIWFNMFMTATFCLGQYYNEQFRFGNLFISDFFVLILVIIVTNIVYKRDIIGRGIKKKYAWIVLCILSMTIMGLANFNPTGFLRDVKTVLYFMVPLMYMYIYRGDTKLQKSWFKMFILICFVTIVMNLYFFFTDGLQNLERAINIERVFNIGLGYICYTLCAVILVASKKNIVSKGFWGIFVYYILHMVCLFSVVVSYTRTEWITYMISVVLCIFICSKKNVNIDKVQFLVSVLALLGTILLIFYISNSLKDTNAAQSLLEKFGRILSTDENDTLYARKEGVEGYLYKLYSPIILVGYGFGDVAIGRGTGAENSFIYFLWKYGAIWNFLIYRTYVTLLLNRFKSNSYILKCIAVYLFIYGILGGMSGHMNKYYQLAYVAFILGLQWDKIIGDGFDTVLYRKKRKEDIIGKT